MKKCLALVLSILVAVSCTGCTGAKQLSERLIIQGIGIDREDEGGYCLTLMYLDTESSTEEETVKVLMAKGKSVMDAMANSISQTGKEPLYSQNLFLLLGMKTAQTGFEEALSFFTTYYEARPNVNVFVCENKAKALLTAEEITPQQIDTISQSERKSGRTVVSTLMQMESDRISGNLSPKTSLLTLDGKEPGTAGTAVFAKDRYVFSLTPEESLGALLISGKADTASELILKGNGSGNIDFTLSRCKSEITPVIDGGHLTFRIKIKASADVYIPPREKESVKTALEERVKKLCEKTIKTSIMENGADIFGFSKRLIQLDGDYYRSLDDVPQALKDARYEVSAGVKIN